MKPSKLMTATLLVGSVFTTNLLAQTQDQVRTQSEVQQQERVYGSELMTQQEMNAYRDRMRSMKTEQERAALRAEHHEEMNRRAAAMGRELPGEPPEFAGQKGQPPHAGSSAMPGHAMGKGGSQGGGGGGKGGK